MRLSHRGETLLEGVALLLLDKDGTLLDLHHYWSTVVLWRAAALRRRWLREVTAGEQWEERLVRAMGVDPLTLRVVDEGPPGSHPRAAVRQRACNALAKAGVALPETAVEALFQEVDQRVAAGLAHLVRPLPGAERLLRQAHGGGVALALVTNDHSARARQALALLGWAPWFRVVVGGDAVPRPKPHPDAARVALARCGVAAARTAAVGDAPGDVRMAVAAGLGAALAVTTGVNGADAFTTLPCRVVADLTGLSLD